MTGSAFPGDAAIEAEADERCYQQFESFVGFDYQESVYDFTTLLPTEDSWEQLDDREILCLIGNYDGTKKAGSARDTGV